LRIGLTIRRHFVIYFLPRRGSESGIETAKGWPASIG
jgi:hypothetical protein